MYYVAILLSVWFIFIWVLQTSYVQTTGNHDQSNCLLYNTNKNCEENHIRFYFLRGTTNIEYYELRSSDTTTIEKANFNTKTEKTKFIVHGHGQQRDDLLMIAITQEYLKFDYNVIIIEYTKLSEGSCYTTGIENSPHIAKCATKMVEDIVNHNKVNIKLQDFHIIGLSLGAQITGQMPNYLGEGYKFFRITGIEPANEGFYDDYEQDNYILTKKDADYVDIVHTNAGFMGKFKPTGHADFYANSGILQPNCPIENYFCSHARAVILFFETIENPLQIHAQKCSSLEKKFNEGCEDLDAQVVFGEHAIESRPEGIFFFNTNTEKGKPYLSSNQELLKYEIYNKHTQVDPTKSQAKGTSPPPS